MCRYAARPVSKPPWFPKADVRSLLDCSPPSLFETWSHWISSSIYHTGGQGELGLHLSPTLIRVGLRSAAMPGFHSSSGIRTMICTAVVFSLSCLTIKALYSLTYFLSQKAHNSQNLTLCSKESSQNTFHESKPCMYTSGILALQRQRKSIMSSGLSWTTQAPGQPRLDNKSISKELRSNHNFLDYL